MRHLLAVLLTSVVLAATTCICCAQVDLPGMPAFGTYEPGSVETINLGNVNIHLTIPLRQLHARNLDVGASLSFDNTIFWTGYFGPVNTPPLNFIFQSSNTVFIGNPDIGACGFPYTSWSLQGVTDSTHTTHDTAKLWLACQSSGSTPPGADGWSISGNVDANGNLTATAIDPHGVAYPVTPNLPPTNIKRDPNGNQGTGAISVNECRPGDSSCNGNVGVQLSGAIVDASGQTVVAAGTSSYSLTPYLTYSGPNGVTERITFTYAQFSQGADDFGCPGLFYDDSRPPFLLTDVTFPDGAFYHFTYEPTVNHPGYYTGRIASVRLPTGGVISYDYSPYGTNGVQCLPNTQAGMTAGFNKTTPDGKVWKYNFTYLDSSHNTTTVTTPSGAYTVYNFVLGATLSASSMLETNRVEYDSDGTWLRTTTTCYNGNSTNCASPSGSVYLNLTQKDVYTYLPGMSQPSLTETLYSNGFVTDVKRFDFGPNQGRTNYVSDEQTVYGSYNSGACAPLTGLPDRTCSVTTFASGSTTPLRQTLSTYDSTGNLSSQKMLTGGSNYLSKGYTYYSNGLVNVATDTNGAQSTYTYGACNSSLPTLVSEPMTLSRSMTWDCSGEVLTSETDYNGNQTTYPVATGYDSMWRNTQANYPDGGQTATTYNITANPANIVVNDKIDNTPRWITRQSNYDGLGRRTRDILVSDPDGTAYTDTGYDGNGRVYTVSNPYRTTNDPTYGVTATQYDGLNRVAKIIRSDGSAVGTTYDYSDANGVCATVVDEASRVRKSCFDGLGRMVKVFEDPSGLNYETDYGYDPLGNLLSVTQKGGDSNSGNWRSRLFQYDALSRLTVASNPESGTINYYYTKSDGSLCSDNPDSVCRRIAPKPNQTGTARVTTTYMYDSQGRLTQKAYDDSATATVKFGYDGVSLSGCAPTPPVLTDSNPKGFRTAMCDGSGAVSYSHDLMDRVTVVRRTTVGTSNLTVKFTYTYNQDGSIATLQYPSLHVVNYQQGTAGRALSVINSVLNENYVTNATYAPQGVMAGLTNGTAINALFSYNSRLQPLQTVYSTGTLPSQTQMNQATCPSTIGNIMHRLYHVGVTVNDNGNVQSIDNCRAVNRTQNFLYDSLNRISNAWTQGIGFTTSWGEAFSIDPWGNLTNVASYLGRTNADPLSTSATPQNRLTGFGYDAAGNMTSNGAANYTYDAEDRLICFGPCTTAGSSNYAYDGDGVRTKKCVYPCSTAGAGTLYWQGGRGDVLTETDLAGALQNEYVFFNDKRVARRTTGNAIYYYMRDHLGSTSVVTAALGTIMAEYDYRPYGGETDVTNTIPQSYKFTGKERDSESALDYFGTRHYAASLGRFIQPDGLFADQDESAPQSWNLYTYVRNNPLNGTDPTGMATCVSDGNGNAQTSSAGVGASCEEIAEQDKKAGASVTVTATVQNVNTYFAMAGFTTAGGFEFGPVDWFAAAALATIGCMQTHCLNVLFSQGTNDGTTPPADNSSASNTASPNPDDKGGLKRTEHGEERKEQARQGDTNRQGDTQRTMREGRAYHDTETGNRIYVRGGHVVVESPSGEYHTSWNGQTAANTAEKVGSGKWEPIQNPNRP